MYKDEKKLDNPVWHSLNEMHRSLAFSFEGLKCYQPEYCSFGGYTGTNKIEHHLDCYSKLINNFFIVGQRPLFSQNLVLKNELVCWQMVLEQKPGIEMTDEISQLKEQHRQPLFELVNLVQPGYFNAKTMELGNYYGIFKNESLVAVTGERMKMDRFTEISAVVTHPAHTGKGYAKQLVIHAVENNLVQDRMPYLHVAEANTAAIGLYERLGFKRRRKISFWNFITRSLAQ